MMRTIALVDDEKTLREAIATFLDLEGFSVRDFGDTHRALEELLADPPDLLITDIRMEGLTGIELLQKLKAVHPTLQAIVLTGFGSYATAVEALRLGVADYLEKPVRLESLRACIDRALATPDAARREGYSLLLRASPAARESCARFLATRLTELSLPGKERRRLIFAALIAVDNALRHAYSPSDTEARITLAIERRSGGAVVLVISDQGRGFEPFSSDGLLAERDGPGGLERALQLVPGMRINSSVDQGTRIEFPIEMEILSASAAWAAWSFAPRGSDPWGTQRPDLPWLTPEMEQLHAKPAGVDSGDSGDAESDEQTARSMLWL